MVHRRSPRPRSLDPKRQPFDYSKGPLTCGLRPGPAGPVLVDLLRRYWNRSDLLEQLRKVSAILSEGGQADAVGAVVTTERVSRSRWLRDRFSPNELQAMIDLYRSGATGREVADKFGVSLRSVKRLLNQHDVRRGTRRIRQ